MSVWELAKQPSRRTAADLGNQAHWVRTLDLVTPGQTHGAAWTKNQMCLALRVVRSGGPCCGGALPALPLAASLPFVTSPPQVCIL